MTLFFPGFRGPCGVLFAGQQCHGPHLSRKWCAEKNCKRSKNFYTPKNYWILEVYLCLFHVVSHDSWPAHDIVTKTPGAHFPTNCAFSGLGKCHDGRVVALQQGAAAFARGALIRNRFVLLRSSKKLFLQDALNKLYVRRLLREMVERLKHVETTMVLVQW